MALHVLVSIAPSLPLPLSMLQMEGKLKEKIEHSLTEKVNFSQVMEALHKLVINNSIQNSIRNNPI